jgi:hypothetical protein
MLPPNFESSAGCPIVQNVGQEYLWSCWQDMIERVRSLPLAAVIVNGDVIDGAQQAQRGTELSLPLLNDQERAAAMCLLALKQHTGSVPWFATQGTEYHDSKGGQAAEHVAESLGCLPYGTIANGTGRFSREFLDLEIDGVVMNFAHGISVAGGFYRATAIDREGIFSALAGKEGKMPKADAVIRSHCHYFVHVEHETKHIAITPCWQLQTRFMRKNSIYRFLPSVGVLLVWFDGDMKRRREDPIVVRKICYSLPAILTTRVPDVS